MKNALKTFEPNMFGRDFVIGDLHGAYPAFQNLLREIHFDPTKDRMFSVGDLVDRGPDSVGCLSLLREDWFHAVLSNHEQMMLQAFNGGRMGQYWPMNGGAWGLNALYTHDSVKRGDYIGDVGEDEQNIIDLVEMVDDLPFLITVKNRNGKTFHILHAELPPARSYTVTDEMLTDEPTVRKLAMSQSGDGDSFLWARSVWYGFYNRTVDKAQVLEDVKEQGLHEPMNEDRSMVISGHTILRKPITILGLTNIDTCAYESCRSPASVWAGLTCINLDTWEFYKATPTTFEVVTPITVNKYDLDTTES
jgi:hypothetical protein